MGGTEQKAREFEHLKKIEEIRAKERQAQYHGNQYDKSGLTPNLTEVQTGESAQIAAAKIGMGKTSAIKMQLKKKKTKS